MFNGNCLFLDSRKEQFKLWLAAYNYKYKQNITYLENNNKPNLSNSWLCGFTDAEGCFTCSIIDKPTNGGLVRLRYILSQKGNYDQMKYLADMLNGKTHYLKSYSGYNMTVNTTKLGLVIKYFDLYPFKTKKHIVYFNWNKMYKLIVDKKHLTADGLTAPLLLSSFFFQKNEERRTY
uniref:LAGLIDADG endonuclease n=1 Tax=Morchella brunnea TaxID=1174671 RepID=A0A8K1MGI6_9PEZI|nr:LAGLIDADG endonuclease [Morchella brunnea]UBU98598.1 LAGLIDADG endonuclease [Morchella brunnea]